VCLREKTRRERGGEGGGVQNCGLIGIRLSTSLDFFALLHADPFQRADIRESG